MFRRYRFVCDSDDYRPIIFPPPGPWWCSGYDPDDSAIIIAYLPEEELLTKYWPEATDIDYTEEAEIMFSDRFPKPDWWNVNV